MGWLRAQSLVSLIMGGGIGLVLVLLGWFILREIKWAFPTALIVVIGVSGLFAYRFFVTKTMMPAGLLAVMSLLTLSALLVAKQARR